MKIAEFNLMKRRDHDSDYDRQPAAKKITLSPTRLTENFAKMNVQRPAIQAPVLNPRLAALRCARKNGTGLSYSRRTLPSRNRSQLISRLATTHQSDPIEIDTQCSSSMCTDSSAQKRPQFAGERLPTRGEQGYMMNWPPPVTYRSGTIERLPPGLQPSMWTRSCSPVQSTDSSNDES